MDVVKNWSLFSPADRKINAAVVKPAVGQPSQTDARSGPTLSQHDQCFSRQARNQLKSKALSLHFSAVAEFSPAFPPAAERRSVSLKMLFAAVALIQLTAFSFALGRICGLQNVID